MRSPNHIATLRNGAIVLLIVLLGLFFCRYAEKRSVPDVKNPYYKSVKQ